MGFQGIAGEIAILGRRRSARSRYAIRHLTIQTQMLESVYPASPFEGWPRSRTRKSAVSAILGRDAAYDFRVC